MPHIVLWVERDHNKPNEKEGTKFTDTDKYQVFVDGDTQMAASQKFNLVSQQPGKDGIEIYMAHLALIIDSTEPHHV